MALGPGSIAFVGFNGDGTDDLSFVALEEIPSGTILYFTDNEFNGTAFNTGESLFAFTVTATIPVGTVINISAVNSDFTMATGFGSVAFIDGSNKGLSNENETVYVYLADAATPTVPTAFLTAVANDGFTAANGVLTNTGLAEGTNALNLGALDADLDVAAFTGARNSQATFAAYRAILNNPANYVFQDASGEQDRDGIAPDTPFSTAAFSLAGAPEVQTIRFTPTSVTLAEGNSGGTAFTFTVTRIGGTTGQVNFSGTFAAGSTSAADFVGGALPTGFSGSIPAGQASGAFTINVAGDAALESDETFGLTLTSASNSGGLAVGIDAAGITATGTILNDESSPTLIFGALPSLQGAPTPPLTTGDVQLVRVGAFTGTGATAAGRAESVAYDPATGRLFVTNATANLIDVAQITANGSTNALTSIALSGLPGYGGVNSVAVRGGIIAVAYQNSNPTLPGGVASYDTATQTLRAVVPAGVLPDQLTFTPDGSRILVANEGEAVSASSNPPGSVTIIDVSGGAASASVINTIVFSGISTAALTAAGVALLPSQGTNDIEPEYISVSPDGTRAYVTLQEVNAVAVIDLTNPTASSPLAIQALGGVDFNLAGNRFDPSDRDNGSNGPAIRLVNADVIGLQQPDAIASFAVGGVTYFITANEGDARSPDDTFGDVVRLNSVGYVLDPTAYPNAAALKADAALGRLNVVTTIGDTDGDGDFDQIYTIGGRGISIFRQNADGTIAKVRETGGEFEEIIARDFPALFNSNQSVAASSFDTRSDDKGPEPEGVVTGVVNGRTYAFVALERVGGIMVYDVTEPADARFVFYIPQTASDLGPETLTFIAAADNPTGVPLVVSANETSGTTTLYRVVIPTGGADTITGGATDDFVLGGAGDDLFLLQGGGNDRAQGGEGNDGFFFGAQFGAGDVANGGAGTNDQVALQGDYPALTLSAGNLVGIETLALLSGDDTRFGDTAGMFYSYGITSVNDNVAAGQNFIVNANGLRAGENFTFNGAAETNGSFTFFGGRGIETLTGGGGNDGFLFGEGRFNGATDKLNGGGGGDNQLALRGDYTAGNAIVFAPDALANIQTVAVLSSSSGASFGYNLTFNDANVAAGTQLTVTGADLTFFESLVANGGSETNGAFRFIGGNGADVLTGGAINDSFFGGLGADSLRGGGGNNSFLYTATEQSQSFASDVIENFDAGDIINLAGVDANTVSGGDQDFTFIGSAAFSGAAGELRIVDLGGGSFRVEANTDADPDAEMVIGVVTQSGYAITQVDFTGLNP